MRPHPQVWQAAPPEKSDDHARQQANQNARAPGLHPIELERKTKEKLGESVITVSTAPGRARPGRGTLAVVYYLLRVKRRDSASGLRPAAFHIVTDAVTVARGLRSGRRCAKPDTQLSCSTGSLAGTLGRPPPCHRRSPISPAGRPAATPRWPCGRLLTAAAAPSRLLGCDHAQPHMQRLSVILS